MSKMTIVDTPHFTLYFHPEFKIVHLEVHKSFSGDPYREALTEGLTLLKNNKAIKWLSDGRKAGVLSKEVAEWGLKIWAPQIIKAGWKYWALALPELVMGELNMKFFVDQYAHKGITVKLFSDPDEGLKWLKEVD
jgi:hypothetical protein